MPSVVQITSDGLDGNQMLLGVVNGTCLSYTIPVRVSSSIWTPDVSQRAAPASGCTDEATSPGYAWVDELLANPFTVTVLPDKSVRLGDATSYVDFHWA